MNEAAVEIEEQIISLFPEKETAVCGGWILKTYAKQLWVHPLYRVLDGDIDERIRVGELNLTDKMLAKITKSKQKTYFPEISVIQPKISASEASMIELVDADREFMQGISNSKVIGRMRISTLFLFDGTQFGDSVLWNILQFAADNRIKKILINLAGCDSLPDMYEEYGFHKLYSCYCYEKQEENKNGFSE